MPLYRYSGNSLIGEARFVKNATRGVRAYLHAREGAEPERLAAAINGLHKAGFFALPVDLDGRPALEVRGFGKADALLAHMKKAGLTEGAPKTEAIKEDKIGFKEWLSKNSFFLTLFIYIAGDLCYIKYEDLEEKFKDENKPRAQREFEETLESKGEKFRKVHDWWNKLAGKGYLAGSLIGLAAMLARPDPAEDEISKACKAAAQSAAKAGIAVDKIDPLARAAHGIGHITPLRRTLSGNYSEYMNGLFAVAGLAIARHNIRDGKGWKELSKKLPEIKTDDYYKSMRLRYGLDTFLGVGTLLSGTYGALATEKAHDPTKPRAQGLGKIWEWMKERPLSVAANGLLVSTVVHLVSSILERRAITKENKEIIDPSKHLKKNHTTYRLGFVIINLIAETIMAFSSKGHGQGVKADSSVDVSACAATAQSIARMPEEQHETLIGGMAASLAAPDALGTPKALLEKTLRAQLAALEKNPWAVALNPALSRPVTQAGKAIEVSPSAEKETAQEAVAEKADTPLQPAVKPSSMAQKERAAPRWREELSKISEGTPALALA